MSLTFGANWPPPNSFTSWRSEAEQVGARQSGRQRASGTARIASPRKLTRPLYLSYGAAPRARVILREVLGPRSHGRADVPLPRVFPTSTTHRRGTSHESHTSHDHGRPRCFGPRP